MTEWKTLLTVKGTKFFPETQALYIFFYLFFKDTLIDLWPEGGRKNKYTANAQFFPTLYC